MCSMMMHGRNNNGKKMMTVRIVNHAFEIIHLLTDKTHRRLRRPHLRFAEMEAFMEFGSYWRH